MTSWTFLFIKCDALPWYRVTALNSFTSAAVGNIVFSHYSSSLDHHSRSMPLWFPAAHVFGCVREPTARCLSFNRNIETASWLFRGKRIKRHCLYELLVRWSGLAPKALIKQQRGMNGWCGVLFPAVSVEYSQCPGGWCSTNDPCPVAIHLLLSFLLWNAANYRHAALILMKAVRGFYREPRPVPRGGGVWCSPLFLPPYDSASHWWHWRGITPVNPFPRCGEAMFVYIDPQHMWHSCCRQRLSLAETRSRFHLATVQLASRRASDTHLTNQYKQWDSKSSIMLQRPQTEGGNKAFEDALLGDKFALGAHKACFSTPQLFHSSLFLSFQGHIHRFCCLIVRWFSHLELLLKDPCVPVCLEDIWVVLPSFAEGQVIQAIKHLCIILWGGSSTGVRPHLI